MSREEFITATEIAFEKLMTPTRGVPVTLMDEPIAEGKWTFKDLAAHLIFWCGTALRALEELHQGREFDWSPYSDFDAANARAVDKLRPLSVKRVMNELRVTHMTVIEAVRRVPEDKLLADGTLPRWLLENTTEHYMHHTSTVAAWVERLRSEGKLPPPLPMAD